jgi:predicted nucleotidyltransferase
MDYSEIREYKPELKDKLPETYAILKASRIKVNPRVKKITLHGSRGLSGKYITNSDLDLCLITDIDIRLIPEEHWDILLRRVLQTTLKNSVCSVELDIAVIFDHNGCGLRCFSVPEYKDLQCRFETEGCMGVYKLQKGWKGILPPITRVAKMYPYITVWEK